MPDMTIADFGGKIPTNAGEIMQFINNTILYHEECEFWDADPNDTDSWESDLVARYLSGDRTKELKGAPEPIYN